MTPTNPVPSYAMRRSVAAPYVEADRRVREALQAEGFGVLTEIDVRATLQAKLGVSFRPYEILGACNPPLAHRALSADADIGLLLPCNVVVQATERPGETIVEALDPVVQLGVAHKPELEPLAAEVRERLVRVLDRVSAG